MNEQYRCDRQPSLSIIVPTYDRPSILRACLDSLARQSSLDFEVIVVCNGSTALTHEVILNYSESTLDIHVVSFSENIWDWDDLSVYYGTIYRSGLDSAKGDYVLFLSDDDALAADFVERALGALVPNPECVAFTGVAVSRYLDTGQETAMVTRSEASARPRIESGLELALRAVASDARQNTDIVDPGFGYIVKTSLYRDPDVQDLIWSGGYEIPQYLALLPEGLVAYDPDAYFYWGRHSEQANVQINARIGALNQYEKIRLRELSLAVPLWQRRYGYKNAKRLDRALTADRGVSALKYAVKAHPYDRCVVWDLGRVARRPTAMVEICRTDAKRVIFWILVPRALITLITRALKRLRMPS